MKRPVWWRTVSRTQLVQHPVLSLRKDSRTAPGFGDHDFYILEFPDWVNVVAITTAKQLVLVRQFRHGLETVTLEIPGGMVDAGETPAQAACRELAEETGYAAGKLTALASVSVNPAIQNNRCHLFLATDCTLTGPQALDGTESIAVELAPWATAQSLLQTKKIDHSINCLALCLALQKLSA